MIVHFVSKNFPLKPVEYNVGDYMQLRGDRVDFTVLGNKIRQLRKDNNLTQEALAEEIGLSYTYLGQIERGTRGINIPNLIVIANRFNVSLDFLLSEHLNKEIGKENNNINNEWIKIIENKTPLEKQKYISVIKDLSKYL